MYFRINWVLYNFNVIVAVHLLLPDVFEDFMHHNILGKMVFCLGEKQSMMVNDDWHSSWYNRVGDFFYACMGEKEGILYGKEKACKVSQNYPTLECEANGNDCYDSWMLVIYLFCSSVLFILLVRSSDFTVCNCTNFSAMFEWCNCSTGMD